MCFNHIYPCYDQTDKKHRSYKYSVNFKLQIIKFKELYRRRFNFSTSLRFAANVNVIVGWYQKQLGDELSGTNTSYKMN